MLWKMELDISSSHPQQASHWASLRTNRSPDMGTLLSLRDPARRLAPSPPPPRTLSSPCKPQAPNSPQGDSRRAFKVCTIVRVLILLKTFLGSCLTLWSHELTFDFLCIHEVPWSSHHKLSCDNHPGILGLEGNLNCIARPDPTQVCHPRGTFPSVSPSKHQLQGLLADYKGKRQME